MVEDEPQPAKKPAIKPKVKAAVELDDDEDDRPRKKRRAEEAGEDDEDQPKKKKKRKRDDADEQGGVSMTRNIVMGVILLILLAVAAYVFYDRSKKKDESTSSNSNSNQAEPPKEFGPPVPGGPSGTGVPGGGGPIDQGGNTGGGKKPIGTPGQPITLTSPAGYKITFPGQYWSNERAAEEMKKRSGLTGAAHECEVGPVQMLCVYLDLPSNFSPGDKKKLTDMLFQAFILEGASAEVTERRTVMQGGQDWEEYTTRYVGVSTVAIKRWLHTESRTYFLAVKKQFGVPPSDAVKRFFDSFELTQSEPKQPVWTPDPSLVSELKQKGEVGDYQMSLPQKFTELPILITVPAHIKMASWATTAAGGEPTATLSVNILSDAPTLTAAGKNMRQMLVNFSAGFTDAIGIKIASRGPSETGQVNGLKFTRFAFKAMGSNQTDVRGIVYGAIDDGRVVTIMVMGFGSTEEAEIKLLESAVTTFKKR